ncbi:MAG: hypothetical protein E6Q62_06555 [Nitrosomonas sp.]|nr:MAG: hypothetical protein E6Q62_06555 [Nitrosomonas sp.]
MKKLALALALAFASTQVMAEWTPLGESELKGGYTAYADLASIRKAGNRVKMWILLDYKIEQKASGIVFLSEKIRREFDCEAEQMRTLAFSLFSWNMEKGDLIRSYSQPQKWEKIQPGSMDEVEWKEACKV